MSTIYEGLLQDVTFAKFLKTSKLNLCVVDENNIAHYADWLRNAFICNRDTISQTFEALSYSLMVDVDGVGIFLTQSKTDTNMVSAIINLNPDPYDKSFVELQLLCAKPQSKTFVSRLQRHIDTFIKKDAEKTSPSKELMKALQVYFKAHNKQIRLSLTGEKTNLHAIKFYRSIGFNFQNDDVKTSSMVWSK